MEKLIVQHSRRHGRLSEFVKSSGETLTVGRGFDNDVILSDHFVDEQQLRFEYKEGQWYLKLLGTTNPVVLNNKPVSLEEIPINSGDQLTVGRTNLILLLSNHPLEQTRKMMLQNWMYHKVLRLALPLGMLLLAALLSVFVDYQAISGKVLWGQLAANGLVFMLMITVWAGVWALIGRLLRHKPYFLTQLYFTAMMMALLSAGMLFNGYVEYITSSRMLKYLVEWGFLLVIFSLTLKYNLSYATDLKKRGTISFSMIAIFMLFIFLMGHLQKREFSTEPEYSRTLKPPFANWSSNKTVTVYLQDLDEQFKKLDELNDSETAAE